MNCSGCGAPRESALCDYCGHVNGVSAGNCEATGSGDGTGPCPRCDEGVALGRSVVGGVAIDSCPRCSGIWISADALRSVLDHHHEWGETGSQGRATSQGSPEANVRYVRCPACLQFMARRNYERVSGVIVDACPEHGVWLDAGELEALRKFAATGGRALTEKAERAKDELDAQLSRQRAVDRVSRGSSRRTVLDDVASFYF